MRRIVLILAVAALAAFVTPSTAVSQTVFRYPRVYGATGSLYGPTQAHYQYRRQYGRAWHGQGGLSITIPNRTAVGYRGYDRLGHHHHAHYGYGNPYSYYYGRSAYGFGGYVGISPFVGLTFGNAAAVGWPGYANYGPVYSYMPMAPIVRQAHPAWIGPSPFNNSVIQEAKRENDERWKQPLRLPARKIRPKVTIIPSTPEARLKSMRHRAHGDDWFRQHKYTHAWSSYRQSITAAADQAEPHFRQAFTYAALGRFDSAVHELKQGIEIGPSWPATTTTWKTLYDEDNQIAKTQVLHKVADWVRADIRDPDRLFLMGVLMHCDKQYDKATPFFETALRLKGSGNHLVAFLNPQVADLEEAAEAPRPKLPPLPAP
ncbi:MAG: hypothetical protein ABGZ17_21465 [Planctomycetaceae bacterium]